MGVFKAGQKLSYKELIADLGEDRIFSSKRFDSAIKDIFLPFDNKTDKYGVPLQKQPFLEKTKVILEEKLFKLFLSGKISKEEFKTQKVDWLAAFIIEKASDVAEDKFEKNFLQKLKKFDIEKIAPQLLYKKIENASRDIAGCAREKDSNERFTLDGIDEAIALLKYCNKPDRNILFDFLTKTLLKCSKIELKSKSTDLVQESPKAAAKVLLQTAINQIVTINKQELKADLFAAIIPNFPKKTNDDAKQVKKLRSIIDNFADTLFKKVSKNSSLAEREDAKWVEATTYLKTIQEKLLPIMLKDAKEISTLEDMDNFCKKHSLQAPAATPKPNPDEKTRWLTSPIVVKNYPKTKPCPEDLKPTAITRRPKIERATSNQTCSAR